MTYKQVEDLAQVEVVTFRQPYHKFPMVPKTLIIFLND